MKKIFILTFIFSFIGTALYSQSCDSLYTIVKNYMNTDNNKVFVSDGQSYTTFLTNEQAEFKTTLYGGSLYRIAASAGTKKNYVIFTIKDLEGNVLFTNKNYYNSPYWDFEVENTLPVTIETKLDQELKLTGCAIMLIGFLK
jgi:hypothetical protein